VLTNLFLRSPSGTTTAPARVAVLSERLREYLQFDSLVFKKAFAFGGLLAGSLFAMLRRPRQALSVWSAIHGRNYSAWANRHIERSLRSALRDEHRTPHRVLLSGLNDHINAVGHGIAAKFISAPERLLGTRALVLKSPRTNERGVIVIDYSFAFPLFARLFDVPRVLERYHLVLEPSWTGYCTPDILCCCRFGAPIFVESTEPRDTEFLHRIATNLVPVPVSANWWVDHRIFKPIPGARKDADLVMVASWSPFKRHSRLFHALAVLTRRGRKLRAIMVGYPNDCTLDDIYRSACHYGVQGQLEFFERLSPEDVNVQLNRAKVNIVWSRREGVNRAIIEGLFAGVPCILRRGFNYGHPYPFINPQTGRFASEASLPDALLNVLDRHLEYSTRTWAMRSMSCQRAADALGDAIKATAVAAGERWTTALAVKVSHLDTMRYWDETDIDTFAADYEFLRSAIRCQ